MIRAFVDSSVLISASFSANGASREIVHECRRGNVALVVSDLVLDETQRNVGVDPKRASAGLVVFKQFLVTVRFEIVKEVNAETELAETYTHPKDAPIVAAAGRAGVDYLCSLDRRHLVDAPEVAERSGLVIVLPEALLRAIREERERSRDIDRE